MKVISDRLIGTKEIMELMESLYGYTTWKAAKVYIDQNHLPIHDLAPHTKKHKYVVFIREIVEHELKQGRSISINNMTFA